MIGDTRPPVINDPSAYPTAVITKIYSDIEAISPRPPFAVSTGDYLFSTANGNQAAPQLDLYTTVGHTHTYGKTGPKQVTIGNGGAPLTGGANYGLGLVQQRADGAIQVDMIDYSTGNADAAFRFALHADGSPAP